MHVDYHEIKYQEQHQFQAQLVWVFPAITYNNRHIEGRAPILFTLDKINEWYEDFSLQL